MQSVVSRSLRAGEMGQGEVATCSLLVRKFFMEEVDVRRFLIKMNLAWRGADGHGTARAGHGMLCSRVPCLEDLEAGCHLEEMVHIWTYARGLLVLGS
jgi:hypothetical protein